MTENIFLIVYCSYEGIDRLLWGGTSSEQAVQKIKEFRATALEHNAYRESDKPVPDVDYDHDFRFCEPDRFCIMQGGEEVFHCCCSALGVSLSESVLF